MDAARRSYQNPAMATKRRSRGRPRFRGGLVSGRWPVLSLLCVAIACATNPATGKRELMLVSEAQEIGLGRQADAEAVSAYGLYDDARLQAYVEGIGRRLAAQSERPALPWSFKVVDDPSVNAFALPGGFIYVTRGILGHLSNEAELAGVLGHEIGHVTARHSASQMSKQQLAMGGLLVGMAVKPELQRFGEAAMQGLGLMFLKFGRDDENEADSLGLRYMTRENYDSREMAGVFSVLDRVTRQAGGGRLPDWLSTHPSPENRGNRIGAQIAAAGAQGSVVRRDEYLGQIDGMVFGENPREGYFRGEAFYHPDLRFEIRFPRGFETQNQKEAVAGASPRQDAIVVLTLAQGRSAATAATQFLSQQGVQAGRLGRTTVNGLPAVAASFEAATEQGSLLGQAVFAEHEGRVYRLLGYAPAQRYASYESLLRASLASFAPLRDRRYLDVEPKRVQLVRVDRDMRVEEFARAYPSTIDNPTLAIVNGLDAGGAALKRGQLAKRVVGGRLPE